MEEIPPPPLSAVENTPVGVYMNVVFMLNVYQSLNPSKGKAAFSRTLPSACFAVGLVIFF